MRYTIGNNQPGPTSPTHAAQLLNAAGLNKFTAHGAVADTSTEVAWDIPFVHSYVLRQTQKGKCTHGFLHNGSKIGQWGKDQDGAASITKAQFDAAGGNVTYRIDYESAGDFTVQGGAG